MGRVVEMERLNATDRDCEVEVEVLRVGGEAGGLVETVRDVMEDGGADGVGELGVVDVVRRGVGAVARGRVDGRMESAGGADGLA